MGNDIITDVTHLSFIVFQLLREEVYLFNLCFNHGTLLTSHRQNNDFCVLECSFNIGTIKPIVSDVSIMKFTYSD